MAGNKKKLVTKKQIKKKSPAAQVEQDQQIDEVEILAQKFTQIQDNDFPKSAQDTAQDESEEEEEINKDEIIRKLAHNDRSVRDRTALAVKLWISGDQAPTSMSQMMHLWKALYFAMWMSDKPIIQDEFAELLASYPFLFKSNEVAMMFFQAFFETMIREWIHIDALRLNKFLSLIRKMLMSGLKMLAKSDYSSELVAQWNQILMESPLRVAFSFKHVDEGKKLLMFRRRDDKRTPQQRLPFAVNSCFGLFQHVTDIYDQCVTNSRKELNLPMLMEIHIQMSLLDPFFTILRQGKDDHSIRRVISSVFDPLAGPEMSKRSRLIQRFQKVIKIDLREKVETREEAVRRYCQALCRAISTKTFDDAGRISHASEQELKPSEQQQQTAIASGFDKDITFSGELIGASEKNRKVLLKLYTTFARYVTSLEARGKLIKEKRAELREKLERGEDVEEKEAKPSKKRKAVQPKVHRKMPRTK